MISVYLYILVKDDDIIYFDLRLYWDYVDMTCSAILGEGSKYPFAQIQVAKTIGDNFSATLWHSKTLSIPNCTMVLWELEPRKCWQLIRTELSKRRCSFWGKLWRGHSPATYPRDPGVVSFKPRTMESSASYSPRRSSPVLPCRCRREWANWWVSHGWNILYISW